MIIYKQFTFDSAHFLPNLPEGHPCKQLHGHTYHLTVYVGGEIIAERGWVIDFTDLKQGVGEVLKQIDHKLLNEVEGLQNPTSELLAVWLWNNLKVEIPGLKKIELKETPTSGVIYEGE